MKHLLLSALAIGLAPAAALAGGHSSFGLSFGVGSYHYGGGWSAGYSSGYCGWGGRTRVVYVPPPVIYQPAPVYVTPAPVVITPAPIYSPAPVYVNPAPVYVNPAPVYVSPTPVYVTPAPVIVQNAPLIVSSPPVYYPSAFGFSVSVHEGHSGRYNYHGGARYSYHRR